ncbi:MAG: hypothetical protein KAS32_10740 [Candidatus Peribacteraceae bacterium]|nr:hypothetical protein [Candidatus Peribacteraceae bacterium]
MAEGDLLTADNPASASTSWRDGVSEEYRSGVAKFDTQNDLAKGYVELERSFGGRVKLPTDESTPDERSMFYNKLGRPEQPSGYNLPGLPEGQEYDQNMVNDFRAVAHEEGITDKAFAKMVETYLGMETKRAEEHTAELARSKEESERAMREKLGDKYDEYVEVTNRAYTEFGGEEFTELMNQPQFQLLLNNQVFIDVFHNIASKTLDDTYTKGDNRPSSEKGYKPEFSSSPEMYRNGEDEESKKARAWFESGGHIY